MNKITDIPEKDRDDLSQKVALIIDNGLFVEIGKTLSVSFKKVYYWMPWVSGFPKSNQYIVGNGIEGIERIQYIWDYIDKIDIFIFPDVYFGDLQLYLVSIGKLVWGGRKGEEMELYRDKMKEYMQSLGLYVTPYEVITGLDDLREYLKKHDNVWVKQNITRGDFESFHSINYENIEPLLDELEHNLGAVKFIKQFIVEEAYDNAVEAGVDMYTIDGQYPNKTLAGIEVKDLGYIGKVVNCDMLSDKITDYNDKISEAFKGYGYRGFFSTEIRISKDKPPYMVDKCSRAGSPPSELYQLMYKNLAEIIWYGAKGILLDPITEKKFGVEALIHSAWADKNWQAISFPKKYRDNVKLRNACVINGKYYCVPQTVGLSEIGAIVVEDDTLQGAIDKAIQIAEQVKGYYIDIKTDSFNEALDEFKKLEKMGIKIL
jgi:hypothetical protein